MSDRGGAEAGASGAGDAASPRTQRSRALLRATDDAPRCLLVGSAAAAAAPPPPPRIAAMAPSALLGRLQAFVPALAEANVALAAAMATAAPDAFAVELQGEEGEDGETRAHIAMEIACGVVELKDAAAQAAAERACAGGAAGGARAGAAAASSDSDDSDESESDSDEEAGEEGAGGAAGGPPQSRTGAARDKRPRIEVLRGGDDGAAADEAAQRRRSGDEA